MNKFLLVGDMHVKRDNLEESSRVLTWVAKVARKHEATIVFMGDQHHDFGLARVEALEFWKSEYDLLPNSISLVGNHDLNADGSASSMTVHAHQTQLITGDGVVPLLSGTYGAIGFIRDNAKFAERVMMAYQLGIRTILCHAEFDGAQFENGFYSPHGIDLSQFPEDLNFISGHIHKRQYVRDKSGRVRVFYVGTPRMLTRSDIGEVKGVILMETSGRQNEPKFTDIPTPSDVAEPFVQVTVEEGVPVPEVRNSPKVYVDIVGSPEFVKKQAAAMPELAKVRSRPNTQAMKTSEVKESDGIPQAFDKFTKKYFHDKSIVPDEQTQALAEVYRRCPFLKGAISG